MICLFLSKFLSCITLYIKYTKYILLHVYKVDRLTMSNQQKEIQNNFESKISVKIEANSRGYNTSIHCYAGVSKKEIDDTINKAIYAHTKLQTNYCLN